RTELGDEHIRRLDVAVDDQIGMRVADRGEHVDKKAQPFIDAQSVRIAIAVDPLSFDVLEDEVRLPGGRYAGVDQPSDVRLREAREDAAFTQKTFLACASD